MSETTARNLTLPPVGSECEFFKQREHGNCHKRLPRACVVKILAHITVHEGGANVAVFSWLRKGRITSVDMAIARCFRPIKTERERAIDEISAAYFEGARGHMGGIAGIYEAGFRKVQS